MTDLSVIIPSDVHRLEGFLNVPLDARGIVLFAHGSGSSRFSKRNQFVANELNKVSIATLLFDLLTPEEEAIDNKTLEYRFDIEFLAKRLVDATHWVSESSTTEKLNCGYFGASTGGGAALIAGANLPGKVKAIVSRGGRPDLAGEALTRVKAPVLLIVGGNDEPVIQMNQTAIQQMHNSVELEIIPNATHLFEEPGTLEKVAELAKNWFLKYL